MQNLVFLTAPGPLRIRSATETQAKAARSSLVEDLDRRLQTQEKTVEMYEEKSSLIMISSDEDDTAEQRKYLEMVRRTQEMQLSRKYD